MGLALESLGARMKHGNTSCITLKPNRDIKLVMFIALCPASLTHSNLKERSEFPRDTPYFIPDQQHIRIEKLTGHSVKTRTNKSAVYQFWLSAHCVHISIIMMTFGCNKTNPDTQISTVKAPNLVLVNKLTGSLLNSQLWFYIFSW